MDIFLPYMTKTLVPKLVEDAPPEAVEAYKTVKKDYANSYQAMDIDKYIERASIK